MAAEGPRVIVTAAGSSRRFGGENKLLQSLLGRPVLAWTLEAFEQSEQIGELVVTAPESDCATYKQLLREVCPRTGRAVVVGGAERQESVYLALKTFNLADDVLVAVHDGARPLLTRHLLSELLEAARISGCGAVPGYTPTDTIKRVGQGFVQETLDRSALVAVQTPQVFPFRMLWEAHEWGAREGIRATDDASLVELRGGKVRVVPGDIHNIKVTTAHDLRVALDILQARQVSRIPSANKGDVPFMRS